MPTSGFSGRIWFLIPISREEMGICPPCELVGGMHPLHPPLCPRLQINVVSSRTIRFRFVDFAYVMLSQQTHGKVAVSLQHTYKQTLTQIKL